MTEQIFDVKVEPYVGEAQPFTPGARKKVEFILEPLWFHVGGGCLDGIEYLDASFDQIRYEFVD